MARSFTQGFRPKNGQQQDFGGPVITGGAGFTPTLSDSVNLGNNYSALRKTGVGFDELAATSVANRAAERATATQLEAAAHVAGLRAKSEVEAAEITADAQKSAASAQAQGAQSGAIFQAIGSIGGALLMSDESTKDNVQAIEDALSTLRQLRPVTFNYKKEWSNTPERKHHGFIAQEYKQVMPDASYYDEEYKKHCIDTNDLIGLLVRAIQQLETRVARMEAANALVGAK